MPDHDPNPLIRLFLTGAAVGFSVSALFVAALWVLDIAGLASHSRDSGDALLLLVVLWVSNGLLFAAVQIGYAVWQMGRNDG